MQLVRHSADRIIPIVLAGALLLSPVASAFAAPSTADIEQKRDEAVAAQAELDDLAAQLELRTEEYYAITAALQETRDEVDKARAELERADLELSAKTDRLEQRAEGMYRSGPVELLEVLLGTTSFQDFLTRMDWLGRIGRNDAEILQSVKEARARVDQVRKTLERREEEQAALRAESKIKQAEVAAAVSRQKTYVDTLNAEVAQLVREEEERQRQLAEERARIAAEEAARRAAQEASMETVPYVDTGELGSGHPEALTVGLQYIGVPYVWGGSTPAGFDCSGLTQYVYREIGISIPRTSREQFKSGTRVPANRADLLAVGDLVFFGYGGDSNQVHHVGIYAGGGNYLHAPYTGASVRVDSLDERISSKGDYVGGSRY